MVGKYWPAICWDFQHLLHFSAYEYFQWVEVGRDYWTRRRPMEELFGFFDILINIQGTKLNEAVLHDPIVIEQMASTKDNGRRTVPIYGQTEIVSLLKTLIDVTAGDDIMPRHKIPGHELRTNRHIAKTHSSIERAQERARIREEATRKREERDRLAALKSPKGT